MLKTTSPYLLDTPAVRYRKIEQRFKQKILFLLKSDSLLGYHDMGQAAGLTETVDETTCRNSTDLQSRSAEFVQDKIFFGEKHRGSLRRKFNPNRKKISKFITSVKICI